MHALTSHPDSLWLAPEPFWHLGATLESSSFKRRPAILRFDTDDFMDELLQVLDRDPRRLFEWRARPETWREPLPKPRAVAELGITASPSPARPRSTTPTEGAEIVSLEPSGDPLKLFQAAHQRHYLVAGSLIERTQNFKDRCVRPARRQVAGFLVRRLVPREGADPTGGPNASGWAELAYVLTPEGPRWVEVAPERAETLLDAEQLNPMFNLGYRSSGVGRRLHAGVLPVGKREAFLAAPVDRLGVDSEDTTLDPRVVRLRSDVVGPWSALIEQARFASAQAKAYRNAATRPPLYSVLEDDLGVSPPATDTSASATQLRETLQTGTWYVAYGLALFLSEHLRPVYEALDPRLPTPTLEPAQQAVVTWLDATQPAAPGNTVATFGALVRAIAATIDFEDPARTPLERVDVPFSSTAPHPDWPTARFLLANPATEDVPAGTFDAEDARLESLVDVVVAAMAPLDEDAVRLGPVLPTRLDGEEAWFQVRCVFSAPQCHPFQPAVVSAPTEAFTMAPFFDPDAPARPVRIALPADISPAGLRKFAKNANFVVSDLLCSRIKGIRKLTLGDLVLSVLPWPFHKDLPTVDEPGPCKADDQSTFGMVCSLSIPIVTLCALILLFIIVQIFDYFFRWMPYLFTCLPIPGLQTKKSGP